MDVGQDVGIDVYYKKWGVGDQWEGWKICIACIVCEDV